MFDTYVTRKEPNYPQHVEISVKENRAPTDESIRILREMEEKIASNIVDRIVLPNGPVPIKLLTYRDSVNATTHCILAYKLGPKEHQVKFTIEEIELLRVQEVADLVVTRLAESLSVTMLRAVGGDLLRSLARK